MRKHIYLFVTMAALLSNAALVRGEEVEWGEEIPSSRAKRTVAETLQHLKKLKAANADRPSGFPQAPGYIEHPVAFHITHKADGTGRITEEQIKQQIEVLNAAFSGQDAQKHGYPNHLDSGFRFVLLSTEYIQDDALFEDCGPKQNLQHRYAVKPDEVLNVYTCNLSYIIGSATLPGSVFDEKWHKAPESDPGYGIQLYYKAFAGGNLANLNLGNVLVHEVGHFYGLLHPYEDSCVPGAPSDFISDTPRMRANAKGSCKQNSRPLACTKTKPLKMPDLEGYMVTTNDNCRHHFTPGQIAFMQASVVVNKPALVANHTKQP